MHTVFGSGATAFEWQQVSFFLTGEQSILGFLLPVIPKGSDIEDVIFSLKNSSI